MNNLQNTIKYLLVFFSAFFLTNCSGKKESKKSQDEIISIALIKKYNANDNWYSSEQYSVEYENIIGKAPAVFKGVIKDIFQYEGKKYLLIYDVGNIINQVFVAKISITEVQWNKIKSITNSKKFGTYGIFVVYINSVTPQSPDVKVLYEANTVEDKGEASLSIIDSPVLLECTAELIDFHIEEKSNKNLTVTYTY